MAYFMRSNDAPDDSRYLMHGIGSSLNSAWGNMKGSWSKAVKYVDKRIVNGRMRYLYPEMLQKARQVGQAAKNTVQKVKTSASNFRNYSTNVDNRAKNANQRKQDHAKTVSDIQKEREETTKRKNDLRAESNRLSEEHDKEFGRFKSALETASFVDDRLKETNKNITKLEDDITKFRAEIDADIESGKVITGERTQKYKTMQQELAAAKEARDKLSELKEKTDTAYAEQRKKSEEVGEAQRSADKASRHEGVAEVLLGKEQEHYERAQANAEREEAAANAEKNSFKYKASRFLDNILDRADEAKDAASSTMKSGASWLKQQMDAGGKWLDGAITNIGTKLDFGNNMRETATKVTNALNHITEVADNTTKAGADFLKNLFGSRDTAPENVVEPEGLPSRSIPQPSSGGRQYNGTSQKAEVQMTEADRNYHDALQRYGTQILNIEDRMIELSRNGGVDSDEFKALSDEHNKLLAEESKLRDARRAGIAYGYEDTLAVPGGTVNGDVTYFARPTGRNTVDARALRNAEYKLQEAREKAGWKMTSNGYSGPSTPEVQAAMEEYLRLRERYGN